LDRDQRVGHLAERLQDHRAVVDRGLLGLGPRDADARVSRPAVVQRQLDEGADRHEALGLVAAAEEVLERRADAAKCSGEPDPRHRNAARDGDAQAGNGGMENPLGRDDVGPPLEQL